MVLVGDSYYVTNKKNVECLNDGITGQYENIFNNF